MAPRGRRSRRPLSSISSIFTVGVLALSSSFGIVAAGEAPAQAAFLPIGDGNEVAIKAADGPITKIHKEGYCAMNGQVCLNQAILRDVFAGWWELDSAHDANPTAAAR